MTELERDDAIELWGEKAKGLNQVESDIEL